MDWKSLLDTLLMPIVIIVIPVVGALLKRFVDGALDLQRVQKLDTIAEGVLGMIILNNPKLDILDDIDTIKDLLVSELLKDSTIPVSNPVIANRVAASALQKAR
jgi:hypothetical protein